MPTTQEEAAKILKISQEYIPAKQLVELFTRLKAEVGDHTENDSLKQSLVMMKNLVDSIPKEKLITRRGFWTSWFD